MTAPPTAHDLASGSTWPPRLRCAGRRTLTISGVTSLWLLFMLAAPLWIAGSLLADLLRRRRLATLRLSAYLAWFLSCEVAGIAALFGLWLVRGAAGPERYAAWNFALQCRWARAVFAGGELLYGLRLEIEGAEALDAGPMLLFPRHVSIGDVMLWSILVQAERGLRMRYVFKRELLWDPCIDIGGHRLPNYFVRRDSRDPAREIAAVVALLDGLGPREGVLIYPEGTRFTPERRERVLRRLRAGDDAELTAAAESMRHVLPPQLGGPLALLERNPGLDVVFCAHEGFEGVRSFRDLLRGELIGRVVRLRFWRVPFAGIPTERAARKTWLLDQWRRVDAFVGAALEARAAREGAGP